MAKKQKKQKDKGKKKGKGRARVTRPSMYTKQIVSRRKPSFRQNQQAMIGKFGSNRCSSKVFPRNSGTSIQCRFVATTCEAV